MALHADLLVFTEFFPQAHEASCRGKLTEAGWGWHLVPPGSGCGS
jgi:hypothetical protein